MAWVWVKQLKNANTGSIMNLIVPVGFTFTGIGMITATHEYQQYNTAHPEYETHVKAISLQEVDPLLNGADKVGTTYAYAANGGGLAITQITRQSANRNQVTWYIKDLWGNTKVNGYQCMMATDAQYNTYVTDNVKCGFCAAVNDETEQMFFGYVVSYHGTYTNDPWYYSWRIDLHMYAYDNNNNVYSIFRSLIPSGGGGNDPYSDGGYSTGTDTGTGTFDDSSESVALPTTYAYSATAAGLISQYVVTEAELRTFGAWLWYGGSIIDDLKHFFQSPMEAIFSVGMLPFTPSDTTNYNIYVGSLDANTTGKLVNDTVEKISMGSITFDGYYGSALDFNPYTKIEIFLPYCGNFALNPDEVMGHTISVDYYCDSVSGDCVAFVSDEDRVLYQVKGNCFVQIPLAARDFTAQYASAIGAVGTVAAGLAASVASGGMSAPIAVGMGTSMASNAMNAKTHIARAGGVSGMAGFMSIQNPYVIITIPNQCLPEFQAEHQGYPLFVTKALKEFSGFTKVYEIHLDGLDCTDAEAKEIYDLLKGGVIL